MEGGREGGREGGGRHNSLAKLLALVRGELGCAGTHYRVGG